jgi:hypothetical protein
MHPLGEKVGEMTKAFRDLPRAAFVAQRGSSRLALCGVLALLGLGCSASASNPSAPASSPGGAGAAGGSAGDGRGQSSGSGGSAAGGAGAGGRIGSGGSGGGTNGAGGVMPGGAPDADPGVPPNDAGTPPASGSSDDQPLPPCKRNVPVASSAELSTALGAAQAGDCIVLGDGSYTFPTITAKGTEASPIVVSAANLLKAVVATGNLNLQGAAYVVVQGISWTSNGLIRLTDTDHGRISRFRLQRMEKASDLANHDLAWITVFGASTYCRVDHNDFGPQNQQGNMVLTTGTETTPVMATHTRIDHNYFHDVHFGGGNGWETIRSGADTLSYGSSFTLIEHNLFKNDANDPEVVSLKSSDNTLRYNTLRASKGQFVLRSGNRDIVYGNYVFGDGVGGSLGIRVGGSGHKIFNNYIEGVGAPGIFLEGGDIDEPSGTLPVPCTTAQCDPRMRITKTDVVFNTVVNAGGITLGGGGHALDPADCNIAYNVVQGPGALYSKTPGSSNITFTGNIGNMGTSGVATGVKIVDPMLMKVGDAYAIGAGSPAVNGGMPSFPYVTEDISGKRRSDPTPDIGANEISEEPGQYKPLTEADVGPMAP